MSRSQPEDEKIVCVSCGLANYPQAHFCVECGAPLDAHSVNDPFDTIKTQGWAYRKVQETPRRLIVVVGVWLMFLPLACGSGFFLLAGLLLLLQGEVPRGAEQRLLFLLGGAVLGAALWISTTIIRRTTSGYLQESRRRAAAKTADADDDEDDDDDSDDGSRFEDGYDDEEDK